MQPFLVDNFIAIAHGLGEVQQSHEKETKTKVIASDIKKRNADGFRSYIPLFDKLGLKVSRLYVERLLNEMEGKDFSSGRMVHICEELKNRMEDECKLRHFFTLSDEEQTYLEPMGRIFSNEIINKLPAMSEDLEEAGKCLALGRYTASVFHLMRIMEIGVQEFGNKIGVTVAAEKVWQVIIQEADKKIRGMDQKQAQTKKYASISSHLYNVKLAWRNEVMHPKATYTYEEAERIISAVSGFLE